MNVEDIIFNTEEKNNIKNFVGKCPFLKVAPLIPYANKFYFYCEIKDGPSNKLAIDKAYISKYCSNENTSLSFQSCKYWQEHTSKGI